MKIGILTYHSVPNFGANLQALSTVEFLKKNGYTPIVINWLPNDLNKKYINIVPIEQRIIHEKFVNSYLPITNLCTNDFEIANVIKENNIKSIIIGSDAVLSYSTVISRTFFPTKKIITIIKNNTDTSYPNPFWGSFISLLDNDIKLIIMSASSQNTIYKYIVGDLKKEMNKSLLKFKYISVRDEWTKKMICYITNNKVKPKITPDPVFAFNFNVDFIPKKNAILKKFNLPENYILISFKDTKTVTEKWIKDFEKLSEKYGIACFGLTMPEGIKFDNSLKHNIVLPLCPLDWYALIKYSKGYIGHNMHPIIVCLHNVVPFFSFDYYGILNFKCFVNKKSSKIYDILKSANLLENHVSSIGYNYSCPSANYVMEKIRNFNKDDLHLFNVKYYELYLEMMNNILSILNSDESI